MNPDWFGDSFDIIKRFFVAVLRSAGYRVYIDPMFTGNWKGLGVHFYNFIGAGSLLNAQHSNEKSALLIDPDIGVGKQVSSRHITIETIIHSLQIHEVVFSFDQSFSRNRMQNEQMKEKLDMLFRHGAHGFYYDSHARFLFAAMSQNAIGAVRTAILKTGMPRTRLVSV